MIKNRVTVVGPENFKPSWRWIARHFEDIDWCFYLVPKHRFLPLAFARFFTAFKAVLNAKNSAVIVAQGPYMAFYCAIIRWLLCIKTPFVVYSFNFAELPGGFALHRMQFAFNKIDKLVVSSTMEIELYANHFNIPAEKFNFVRWGVNKPEFINNPPKLQVPAYICAVGGNARDYRTFIEAMRALPEIPAIIVVRPHNLVGLKIPDNVTVFTNIPKDDAYSVIANSRLMVLPLAGNEIPCGHVTIVVAMYLGIPSVITDSSGVDDYVTDGETGLLCIPGSDISMREAILKLWLDQDLCSKLSANGMSFAQTMCSEQNYVTHFKHFIERARTQP